MTPITYLGGDATRPQAHGPRIVAHVCNDLGAWGRGFSGAVSKRWPVAEVCFRGWHRGTLTGGNLPGRFEMGQVQFVVVSAQITVASMVAQRGLREYNNPTPIAYDALRTCLGKVAEHALRIGASVHCPRLGCGLAGGTWAAVEPIITEQLSARGVAVFVYDPGKQ